MYIVYKMQLEQVLKQFSLDSPVHGVSSVQGIIYEEILRVSRHKIVKTYLSAATSSVIMTVLLSDLKSFLRLMSYLKLRKKLRW